MISIFRSYSLSLAVLLACATVSLAKVTFDEQVKQIFREHCAGCHNQDDAASDLALDGFEAVIAGGAGGEVLVPGDPDGSRLWRLINHDEEPIMPPGSDKLPEKQLAIVRAWIEEGLMKNSDSKPMASRQPKIAAVEVGELGKPVGEPAMPSGLFREPMLTSPSPGPIDALATSPWAPLAAVPWQRQVSLYHTESYDLLGVIPYLEGVPRIVRFSRDGALLLVAGGLEGASGKAALFDVASGARLATIGDELDTVLAADISPDNQLVAIGGPKKKVRVYRVADGSLVYTCEKHTDWITALAFSPDGRLLATGDRVGGLRLWDASAGHERADLRGHNLAISAVAWRRDGGVLASASEDGTVRLWSPNGKAVKSFNAHGGGTLSVEFAADGRLATTGRDRRVKLWKPDGAAISDLATLPETGLAAVFTHDSQQVIASDWAGAVRIFAIDSKKEVAQLTPNPPTLAMRLAEVEKRFVSIDQQWQAARADHESAVADLDEGRRRHEEHNGKLADAQLAVDDAIKSLEGLKAVDETPATEIAASEETVAKSKQHLAKLSNQIAGLPDLAALEAEVAQRQQAIEPLAKQRSEVASNRDALTAEREAYHQAADELTAVVSTTVEVQQELEKQAEQLTVVRDEHAVGATEAAKKKEQLQAKLDELKQQLTQLRKEHREAEATLNSAETSLAEQTAKLQEASRRAALAESRLKGWQAAQAWHEDRQASQPVNSAPGPDAEAEAEAVVE